MKRAAYENDSSVVVFFSRFSILRRAHGNPRQARPRRTQLELATLIRTIVILIVIAALVSVRKEWAWPENAALKPIVLFVFCGVATGLSRLCYYRALQLANALMVAPIDKLSVAFAILLAVIVLGEPLTWQLALGGALIIAGALVIAIA